MPSDNVVDADTEVCEEPEQDDGRKQDAQLARPQPLEEKQQHQNGTGYPDDPRCNTGIASFQVGRASNIPLCSILVRYEAYA